MPKKKQPKNAFYFFMLDFREQEEQMGVYFRGGMRDVAEKAGPAWNELPLDQRAHYENMAAEHKLKEKGNWENKFTTTGISYAQLHKEEMERRRIETAMKMEIISTVQRLHRESTLKSQLFYFVHFNYYCRIEDGSYLICEVAIAQFNLENGVQKVFHTIIRQDKIPTGYSFEAKSTAEETHQIPLPHDLKEGEPYHGDLFIKIKAFLDRSKNSNGELPPMYSIDSHVDVAQDALTRLAEYHYPQNPDLFRVYPLSKLFFHLRNAAAPHGQCAFPAETLAMRELDKDQFNFAPGIACPMHEKNDTCVFCSMSIVQRWAFLICDHCCKDLGIPVLPGKHVPINAAIPKVEKVDKVEIAEEGFTVMAKRGSKLADFASASASSSASGAAAASPPAPAAASAWSTVTKRQPKPQPVSAPMRVVDCGKAGPPSDSAHHYNINANAVPNASVGKAGGNCWGMKSSDGSLRRPADMPPSVRDALSFTDDDFPDLGRSVTKTPAAVAGRGGRGRTRFLQEEISPGGLNEDENAASGSVQVTAGRGRGRLMSKPVPRLAANLQGLQLD